MNDNIRARVNTYNVRMMCLIMYSVSQRMLRERVHLRGRVCVLCVMQVDTSVPVSCATATTCASMCIDGAQRTTLNVPGAAPKFSGGISRRDKKTIRPVRAHRWPQSDLWETVKRPRYFRTPSRRFYE